MASVNFLMILFTLLFSVSQALNLDLPIDLHPRAGGSSGRGGGSSSSSSGGGRGRGSRGGSYSSGGGSSSSSGTYPYGDQAPASQTTRNIVISVSVVAVSAVVFMGAIACCMWRRDNKTEAKLEEKNAEAEAEV